MPWGDGGLSGPPRPQHTGESGGGGRWHWQPHPPTAVLDAWEALGSGLGIAELGGWNIFVNVSRPQATGVGAQIQDERARGRADLRNRAFPGVGGLLSGPQARPKPTHMKSGLWGMAGGGGMFNAGQFPFGKMKSSWRWRAVVTAARPRDCAKCHRTAH